MFSGNGVTGDDVVAGLEGHSGKAWVVNVHALAPGKEVKQPGLVSTCLLSATGCGERAPIMLS